ncbi:hypothetical protein ACFC09_16595 [Streptomyces sp. NPDC056161]|uniref:hypothetical protein n=1 Tax=Streptomyces sp. NPDC056161 TaxID=3345732 RepID=UPI0035E0E80D
MTRARSLAVVSFTLVVGVTGVGCSTGAAAPPARQGSAHAPSAPPPTESNPPGDIPDNQAYVAFQGNGFTVRVPEGWARGTQGADTVYTDKLNTVRITETTAAAAPTVASVGKEVVPRLRGQVPKFASAEVSQVSRKGGQAVRLTYQGDSATDPVTGKVVRDAFERYAFHRAGREVDLTLSGPVGADNVDPWRIVTDSFTWR